jgi:hypothetical protein
MKSLICLFLFPVLCFGASETLKFELPINWTSDPKINLEVSIPETFHSLQPMDQWKDAELIEFVPNGEEGENWSEIITINKYIGDKIDASTFVSLLKDQLLKKIENGKVLEESSTREENYTKATLSLSYDEKGGHEILSLQYFSGPFDCVGLQYTIRSARDQEALEKIQNYFKMNTKVVR